MNRILQATLVLSLTAVAAGALAADKALLIGVSSYPNIDDQLPGIDLDLRMMQETAGHLGFAPGNVKVLYDEQATVSGIEAAINDWLVDGVSPDDRVLVYFSGHGSRVPDTSGDEADGRDEVLLAYDAKHINVDGSPSVGNVVRDDEFREWLARIPSNNITVLIDACHSGSVTRSFGLKRLKLGEQYAYSKSFTYDGAPAPKGLELGNIVRDTIENNVVETVESSVTERIGSGSAAVMDAVITGETERVVENAVDQRIASLTAARDDQQALATGQGSVFTLAISSVIEESARTGRDVTLEDVQRQAEQIIAETVDPEVVHNPVLSGDARLMQATIETTRLIDGNGPQWSDLQRFVARSPGLVVSANSRRLTVGDELIVTVDIPFDGYLNIVSVDSEDATTVLFPNKYHSDNKVAKGRLSFPTDRMPFAIQAQDPTGPTLVAAYLTPKALNLQQSGIAGRDDAGEIVSAFTSLSAQGAKALEVVPRMVNATTNTRTDVPAAGMTAGSVVVHVSPKRSRDTVTRVDVMRPLLASKAYSGRDVLNLVINPDPGIVKKVELGDKISFQIDVAGPADLLFAHFDSFGNATLNRPAVTQSADGNFSASFPAQGTVTVQPPLGTDNAFVLRVPKSAADQFVAPNETIRVPRADAATLIMDIMSTASTAPDFAVDSIRYRVTAPNRTFYSSSKAIVREFEEEATAPAPIEFNLDSSMLTPGSRLELDQFGDALVDGPFRRSRVRMVGHTDASGSEDYNEELAGVRAKTAHSYLISKYGLDAARFELRSEGEKRPLASNDTDEGRARNRRVQFEIIK